MSTEYKIKWKWKVPSYPCALTENGETPTAWWPNNLNLDILHQHDEKTNPMDKGYKLQKRS